MSVKITPSEFSTGYIKMDGEVITRPGFICNPIYKGGPWLQSLQEVLSCLQTVLPDTEVGKDASKEQQPEDHRSRREAFQLQSLHTGKQPCFMKILKQENPEKQNIYNRWPVSWYEYSFLCKRFNCSIALNMFLLQFINGFLF